MEHIQHIKLSKADRDQLHAERLARERLLLEKLRHSRVGKNHFIRTVEALHDGREADLQRMQPRDLFIQEQFAGMVKKKHVRKAFRDLLLQLDAQGCDKFLAHGTHLCALALLALEVDRWVHPITAWNRPSRNMDKQFSSLLRHCLSLYPVPELLDQAWLEKERKHEREWWLDIGRGRSIRHSRNVPVMMTKKIAHMFMIAPCGSIDEALRWGQVMGQGGEERMAQMIAQGRLGRNSFEHENYWSKVIQFFIKHRIAHDKLGEVIDMLSHHLSEGHPIDLKGRTNASLIRLCHAWHEEINRQKKYGSEKEWIRCTYQDGKFVTGSEENEIHWTVRELLSPKELALEGRTMRHCVFTYSAMCAKRVTAIFSLSMTDAYGTSTPMGTLEVSLRTARIVQAKSRYNAPLRPRARAIMGKWARKEGLTITEHL